MSQKQENLTTLNHEYGHKMQFDDRGIIDYTFKIFLPSITANILDRMGKLSYDYYGSPWEAEADILGGVNRYYDNTLWPENAYNSYWDLIVMFWE